MSTSPAIAPSEEQRDSMDRSTESSTVSKQRRRSQKLAKAAAAKAAREKKRMDEAADADEADEDAADERDEPLLKVMTSSIPGAGDGLFLTSELAPAGSVLLAEDAIAIRRPAATKIMSTPEWRGKHPVIQLNSDRFLDIRRLTLYKSNHTPSSSPRCNAHVAQSGPARLTLTALRDIRRGEEILWEYSASMQM